MIEINNGEILLTPYKWTYEERRLYKTNENKFFEKNYSKWVSLNVDHIDDLVIIGEKIVNEDEPCYLIEIVGSTYVEDQQDTYYEYWWGNKKFKEEFKEKNYGWMDSFLEDKNLDITEDTKITAMISKKDYKELKKYVEEQATKKGERK